MDSTLFTFFESTTKIKMYFVEEIEKCLFLKNTTWLEHKDHIASLGPWILRSKPVVKQQMLELTTTDHIPFLHHSANLFSSSCTCLRNILRLDACDRALPAYFLLAETQSQGNL